MVTFSCKDDENFGRGQVETMCPVKNQCSDMRYEKGGGFQKSNQGFVALWLMGEAGLWREGKAGCSLCPGLKE
jgi:hypothetical protein